MRAAMKAVRSWLWSSSLNGTNGRINTISGFSATSPPSALGS